MAISASIAAEARAAREAFVLDSVALNHFLRDHVRIDLARRALLVESMAKRIASATPRSGPNSGSEPGGGPAVRTGRLRASITWRPGEDAQGPYVDIGSAVHYAAYVELGTSRMAARPYLRPALAAARG